MRVSRVAVPAVLIAITVSACMLQQRQPVSSAGVDDHMSHMMAADLAAPVGASYADGQYWDELDLTLPAGTERVEARLM